MKAILTLAMAATIGMCQYSHAASTRHLSVKTDSAKPAILRLGKACHRLAPASGSSDQEEWTLVGTGSYTGDILTNSGVESATWDVDIYESASTPGFYRVANPFGNGNCPTFPDPFECCDFLLHAENPDAVWMEFVEMKNVDFGIMDGEYCPAFIGDMAGYYIDAGYYCYGQQENASEWTDIGQAEYSEDVLASIYPEDLSHVVYKVDVQQNNANPGRYPLVNTYGPSCRAETSTTSSISCFPTTLRCRLSVPAAAPMRNTTLPTESGSAASPLARPEHISADAATEPKNTDQMIRASLRDSQVLRLT